MDEFVESVMPRLCNAIADHFRLLLSHVPEGHTVYAAAIAHADGSAWRPDLNTEEALVRAADGSVKPNYRWWPDEWTAVNSAFLGVPATLEMERELTDWAEENLADEEWNKWHSAVVRMLEDAIGSPEVHAVFAEAGARPILVVNDTDGDYRPALASVRTLNGERAGEALFEDAVAFWESWV